MAVAVGSSITVTKVLPAGVVTSYTDVSLYKVISNVTTRYNVTVVNSTLLAAGSLTAINVAFATSGIHVCTFSSESYADLDINGVVITPIATTNIVASVIDTAVTI